MVTATLVGPTTTPAFALAAQWRLRLASGKVRVVARNEVSETKLFFIRQAMKTADGQASLALLVPSESVDDDDRVM